MSENINKYIPDQLTDDNVIDVDFFREDLLEMYDSTMKIDDLANKLDENLNEIYFDTENRQMMGRGVLTFATSTMETLASLRTSKCNSMNQIISSKLKISQLALSKKKNEESGTDAAAIAKEFNKLFLQHSDELHPKSQQEDIMNRIESGKNIQDDELLNKRLNDLTSSGELEFSDNERAMKYERRGVVFKIVNAKTNPRFVACARDNNEILNDYPTTLYPDIAILNTATISGDKMICSGNVVYDILSL